MLSNLNVLYESPDQRMRAIGKQFYLRVCCQFTSPEVTGTVKCVLYLPGDDKVT